MQGRQAQILWCWATSMKLTPRSRPWRTSLKRVSFWARPNKQSHDFGGLMDRSSRELGRHQKRRVSMWWSGARLCGHCWSTRTRSSPATVSLSRRWSLLPCFSPLEHPFWHCYHFFIARVVTLALELSVTVVTLSFVYECTLLRQRRDNKHLLRQLGQQDKEGRGTIARSMVGSRWRKYVSHQGEHPRHCQVNGQRSTSRDFAPQQNAQSRGDGHARVKDHTSWTDSMAEGSQVKDKVSPWKHLHSWAHVCLQDVRRVCADMDYGDQKQVGVVIGVLTVTETVKHGARSYKLTA